MCPSNFTNFEDGSSTCSVPIIPGTNLRMRYAVIVSFGVFLNGTDLDSVAAKVGCSATVESPTCNNSQTHSCGPDDRPVIMMHSMHRRFTVGTAACTGRWSWETQSKIFKKGTSLIIGIPCPCHLEEALFPVRTSGRCILQRSWI